VGVTVVGTGASPHIDPVDPIVAGRGSVDRPPPHRRHGLRATIGAYVALTKPRIIELLLVTTVPTMFLAADGVPSLGLVVATFLGGTLAAGSANSLNCFFDRDIDGVMSRTGGRPLATHQVSPRSALTFGVVLGVVSLAVMSTVNALATALTAFAIGFYVVVYTVGLKRRTSSNIVWGGIAGCMPVLIAWAAVTGTLAAPAWILFLVVFWWTPPHFWALALRFRDDYAAAGVPMLPVVAEPRVVVRRILGHSSAMVVASLVLWPVAGLSVAYLLVAVVLGGIFLASAATLRARVVAGLPEGQWKPMHLFHWSITYLTLLFVMVGLDPFLPF
jgi:protoheme IX farnesyltransferase